jgi:hypothetical protein
MIRILTIAATIATLCAAPCTAAEMPSGVSTGAASTTLILVAEDKSKDPGEKKPPLKKSGEECAANWQCESGSCRTVNDPKKGWIGVCN